MKAIILTALLLVLAHLCNAQIKAITETGDEVILYDNGTWKHSKKTIIESPKILTNKKEFLKDKNSIFLIKSTKLNAGIWIDPKNWRFEKGKENDASEYNFTMKGSDLYAMLISEKTQIPIESLKDIAVQNAKEAALDVTVDKEEYRNINGIKVLMMQMSGTLKGIKFIYYGYYYSNANGTIQFVTYTSQSLLNDYKNDIELFLNGLVEL